MISLVNLNFGYDSSRKVLENINLQLPEGHIYGLLGQNGVGKSTLMNVIAGLLKGEGECKIDGISSHEKSLAMLQDIYVLGEEFSKMSNESAKGLAKFYQKIYPNFDMDYFLKIAEELIVDINVKIRSLSMGGSRKAMIALALACNTRYLLMDEPTNGLDITSKIVFRKLIAAHANEDRTIIISTHMVDDVEDLLDAVIIMKQKEILLSASIAEIGQKLCFGQIEEGDEAIYSKDTISGRVGVVENLCGEEMPVDIKMLFVACMENSSKIKEVFN